eukprot:scaffold11653_cov35-Phaeocystis_antarctica.AAC.1
MSHSWSARKENVAGSSGVSRLCEIPDKIKIRLLGFTRYTTSMLRSSAMLGPSHLGPGQSFDWKLPKFLS